MVSDLLMPKYSLTMEKGTVIKWLKKEGDAVEKGESIVEIEADKVTAEVESPTKGFLLKICIHEKAEVSVGEPLAFIGKHGEQVPETKIVIKEPETIRKEGNSFSAKKSLTSNVLVSSKIRASPVARRLAKQLKIDLTRIIGTGPKGRITQEDVKRFVELHRDTRSIKEVTPMSALQKTIAKRMSLSVKTAAHCSVTIEVDASNMNALRLKLNDETKKHISHTAMLVKSLAKALRENPVLNSTFEENHVKIYNTVNIGVAVEVNKKNGILVPVIKDADNKTIMQVSEELDRLVKRVKGGIASYKDLTGGTFTITNLGMYKVDVFVPIINPPETAILGVGVIKERVMVIDGKVEIRPLLHLTLSFDHRVVNGAPAARFMQRLKEILESKNVEKT